MKLVELNKEKKVAFYGDAKLKIDSPQNCLIITKNEDLSEIVSSYDRIHVPVQCFLFIFDNKNDENIALIFASKEKCDMVLAAINNKKYPNGEAPSSDAAIVTLLLKQNFISPLFKEIRAGCIGHEELRILLVGAIDSLDSEARVAYMNMMLEAIPSVPSIREHNNTMRTMRHRRRTVAKSKLSVKAPIQKRKHPVAGGIKKEGKRSSGNNFGSLLEVAAYEFKDDAVAEIRHLLIYTSAERTHCYEFMQNGNVYACKACREEHQHLNYARVVYDKNGIPNFHGSGQHVCEPMEYNPEKYVNYINPVISAQKFQLVEKEVRGKTCLKLIVFNGADKTTGYEYSPSPKTDFFYCSSCKRSFNRYTSARIIKNGTQVLLGPTQHRCQPINLDLDSGASIAK